MPVAVSGLVASTAALSPFAGVVAAVTVPARELGVDEHDELAVERLPDELVGPREDAKDGDR